MGFHLRMVQEISDAKSSYVVLIDQESKLTVKEYVRNARSPAVRSPLFPDVNPNRSKSLMIRIARQANNYLWLVTWCMQQPTVAASKFFVIERRIIRIFIKSMSRVIFAISQIRSLNKNRRWYHVHRKQEISRDSKPLL